MVPWWWARRLGRTRINRTEAMFHNRHRLLLFNIVNDGQALRMQKLAGAA